MSYVSLRSFYILGPGIYCANKNTIKEQDIARLAPIIKHPSTPYPQGASLLLN